MARFISSEPSIDNQPIEVRQYHGIWFAKAPGIDMLVMGRGTSKREAQKDLVTILTMTKLIRGDTRIDFRDSPIIAPYSRTGR
jgi:hypothetical protein